MAGLLDYMVSADTGDEEVYTVPDAWRGFIVRRGLIVLEIPQAAVAALRPYYQAHSYTAIATGTASGTAATKTIVTTAPIFTADHKHYTLSVAGRPDSPYVITTVTNSTTVVVNQLAANFSTQAVSLLGPHMYPFETSLYGRRLVRTHENWEAHGKAKFARVRLYYETPDPRTFVLAHTDRGYLETEALESAYVIKSVNVPNVGNIIIEGQDFETTAGANVGKPITWQRLWGQNIGYRGTTRFILHTGYAANPIPTIMGYAGKINSNTMTYMGVAANTLVHLGGAIRKELAAGGTWYARQILLHQPDGFNVISRKMVRAVYESLGWRRKTDGSLESTNRIERGMMLFPCPWDLTMRTTSVKPAAVSMATLDNLLSWVGT